MKSLMIMYQIRSLLIPLLMPNLNPLQKMNWNQYITNQVPQMIFNSKKIRYGNLIGFEVYREDKHSEAGTGFQRYFLLEIDSIL